MLENSPNYGIPLPNKTDEDTDVADSLSSGLTIIDTELKNRKDELDAHKNSSTAHSSNNISHGDGTVETAFVEVNTLMGELDTRVTETANSAVTTANNAVTTAETVQVQFNQVVAEAGTNNPEVVQARGSEVNLNARLDKADSSLAEKATITKPELFGAVGNGVTDDTQAFTNMFNSLKSALGKNIIIELAAKTYIINNISIAFKCTFLGSGKGITILKQKNGANTDFITVANTAVCVVMKDLTLSGNSSNTIGSGLVFSTTQAGMTYGLNVLDSEVLPSTIGDSGYKWTFIHNVAIKGFSEYGIYINPYNYRVHVDACDIVQNGKDGIYANCNDSFFSNLYCEQNGWCGINCVRSNNKFANIKCIWNGKSAGADQTVAGFKLASSRNLIENVEAQDNYCHGFYINNSNNSFVNCLSDRNGYLSSDATQSNGWSYGFYINADENYFSNCIVAQYTGTVPIACAPYYITPVSIKNLRYIDIHVATPYFISTTYQQIELMKEKSKALVPQFVDITPSIATADGTTTGISFKKINNNTAVLSGTATADTSFYLFGAWGNISNYLVAPVGTLEVFFQKVAPTGVVLQVITDGTTIWESGIATSKEEILTSSKNISGIVVKITNGTTVNNLYVSPKFLLAI